MCHSTQASKVNINGILHGPRAVPHVKKRFKLNTKIWALYKREQNLNYLSVNISKLLKQFHTF